MTSKLLYLFTPIVLGIGVYASNAVLICGGIAMLCMIVYRWRPGQKREKKRRVSND